MVLVDYLRKLALRPEYQIGLAISTKMDELEVFADAVPSNVTVYHLVSQQMLTRWRKQKVKGTVPVCAKLYDETLLSPIRRLLISRRLKRLANDYDVMIDFDCCHYSFLKNIPTKKLAWFHFSFKHLMEQNPRRTQRIGL